MSYREQGYTGASPAEHGVDARLAELNAAYEQKFGFRFVVFVNKRPRAEIVKVLEGRLYNDRGAELATGRREMFLIARDRLCSLS
jgi:2-oxo-4-hydroxy-4-carboxy-5-ureidoimidazoline decarboxylase